MSKIFKVIIYSVFLFLITYSIIEFGINNYSQDYKIQIVENENTYKVLNDINYWEEVITNKSYDVNYGVYKELFNSKIIEDGYLVIDGKNISYQGANYFLRQLFNYKETTDSIVTTTTNQAVVINRINAFVTPFIISITAGIVMSLLFKKVEKEYDSIFSKKYWINAYNENKSIKKISLMSILMALQLVIGIFIKIPSGFSNLGIGLSYLVLATNCMLFGPISAILIGGIGDIIGYVISPSPYGFFFGYTLNAIIAAFVYAILFYKTKITFTKVLFSRIIVNLFVNVLLGSIWWAIVAGLSYDQALTSMLYISLPKNVVYLLPQSIMLFITFKAIMKLFYLKGYVEEYQIDIKII